MSEEPPSSVLMGFQPTHVYVRIGFGSAFPMFSEDQGDSYRVCVYAYLCVHKPVKSEHRAVPCFQNTVSLCSVTHSSRLED